MIVIRFMAWIIVGLAIALIGADGVSSLQDGEPVIRSTSEILSYFGVDGFDLAAGAPAGVDKMASTILELPMWAVLGLVGIVLTLIFRPID